MLRSVRPPQRPAGEVWPLGPHLGPNGLRFTRQQLSAHLVNDHRLPGVSGSGALRRLRATRRHWRAHDLDQPATR